MSGSNKSYGFRLLQKSHADRFLQGQQHANLTRDMSPFVQREYADRCLTLARLAWQADEVWMMLNALTVQWLGHLERLLVAQSPSE